MYECDCAWVSCEGSKAASGTQTSALPIRPRKPRGSTPITVYGVALMRIVRPTTAGSPPKRRVHKPWLIMAAGGVPACVHLVPGERASHQRRDAEDGRIPLRDDFAAHALRLAVAGEIEVAAREERDLVEHLLRRGERPVLRVRPDGLVVDAGTLALRHQHVHEHQPLGVGERQRLEQHGVDDGEDRGIGADAERERGDGDRRKCRRAAQQPQRVADVLEEIAHGTVSFIDCGLGRRAPRYRKPMSWCMCEDAPHLPLQPSPRGTLAARVADSRQLLDRVADHPFALAGRRGQPDHQQRQAGHDSVFRRRSIPAVMPVSAR